MRNFWLAVPAALLAATISILVGQPKSVEAASACFEAQVRTTCPSGQIDPRLIPTATSTATSPTTLVVSMPNATKTWSSTATNTLTQTDVCTTIAASGAIPCAGTDSKISTGWIPSLSSTYVPWSQVEGTGTATSTETDKIVTGADGRLSNARTPTGSLTVLSPGFLTTGTGTDTSLTAAFSDGPVIHFSTADASTALSAAYDRGWRWFYPLAVGIRNWRAMTVYGTNVYAVVPSGDIYKQTGGSGSFTALSQTTRTWSAIGVCGSDVYASDYGGDIYKQTNGTGNFVALSQTSRNWNAIATIGTDIYAIVYGGSLYKQTNCTGNFVDVTGITSRNWYGLTALGSNLYASVYSSGDIYKRTSGDFIALSQTARDWRQMASDGTHVYIVVYNGDIYKQANGTGDFFATGQIIRNWHAITVLSGRLYAAVYGGDIFTSF